MGIIRCPHCHVRVIPLKENICPSCLKNILGRDKVVNLGRDKIELKDFAEYARPRSTSYTNRWILCEILAWGAIPLALLGVFISHKLLPEIGLILGLLAGTIIPFFIPLRRLGARFRVDSLNVILSDKRAPILYLRPFSHDVHVTPQGFLKRPSEMILQAALKDIGPLVAVGRPGEELPPLGATRVYFPNSEWKDRVTELMSISKLVIIETGSVSSHPNITYSDYTEGLKWEVSTASATVKPGRWLISSFYTQLLGARMRMEELRAFKLLASDTWGFQIPDLHENCYFMSIRGGLTAEVAALPRWKQLLYGKCTIAGVREALRPLLSKEGIQLPRLRGYMIVGTKLACLYLVYLEVSIVISFPFFMLPLFTFSMLLIYGLSKLNLDGDGVMARFNRLLLYHVLKEE